MTLAERLAQAEDALKDAGSHGHTLWLSSIGDSLVGLQVGRIEAEANLAAQLIRSVAHRFELLAKKGVE